MVGYQRDAIWKTAAMIDKDSRIIILGAGAWGLLTALHLTSAGYFDITVLDRAEAMPFLT
jgi:sarcosine oxidase/L-pipecolate oxidase